MILLLAACTSPEWADVVIDAPGADPAVPYADASLAVNGAYGAGFDSGGTDVYSLTLDGLRPTLTVGFSGRLIIDTPGPDFVVYENGFDINEEERFMDPIIVSASADGIAFIDFPHSFAGGAMYSTHPGDWEGFAGITPTARDESDEDSPEADDEDSGGDRFDFRDLPAGVLRDQILRDGARAIRLRPAGSEFDPSTGDLFPVDPVSNGPDIDAVYAWAFSRD